MSSPTVLIGKSFSGGYKWGGGVLASDGCIYCPPYSDTHILKIDPTNSTSDRVGRSTFSGIAEHLGAVAPEDGHVYFTPFNAAQFLKFNIQTKEAIFVGGTYPGDAKWGHGAMGSDNCVYCAPRNASQILKLDPKDDSTELVGEDRGDAKFKYFHAVATKDKASIYFFPYRSKTIVKYDVGTGDSHLINIEHLDDSKLNSFPWVGFDLGTDGCIYGIPNKGNKILKLDPSDDTATLVGNHFICPDYNFWSGAVASRDGCIYGIPRNATQILRYNIVTNRTMFIGESYIGSEKWGAGCLDKDGNIIAAPRSSLKVLKIFPSMFNNNSISTTTYQSGGLDDSPNTSTDRLGFEVYAEALVSHIRSVENSGQPISIGFFSPWGSGKSFMWHLTMTEFKRLDALEEEAIATENHGVTKTDDGFGHGGFYSFRLKLDKCYWKGNKAVRFLIAPLIKCVKWLNKIDTALRDSERWKDKYQWAKGKIRLSGRKVASYSSLAVIALWSLVAWFKKILRKSFSALFFFYYSGYWKMPDTTEKKRLSRIYVEFDAWTYRGTENIWASMLEKLWREVEEEVKKKFQTKEKINWHRAGIELAKKSSLFTPEKERKDLQIKMRKDLQIKMNAYVAFFAWMIVFFIYAFVRQLVMVLESSDVLAKSVTWTLIVSISTLLVSMVRLIVGVRDMQKYSKNGWDRINEKINIYKRRNFKGDKGYMGIVDEEVRHLFTFLNDYNLRIVLFVDDLDRCEQNVSMQVLWAISLLLGGTGQHRPVTSFLAIDTKVIVDYIEADFKIEVNGFRYLEKIIHLPFAIPPMDDETKIHFCKMSVNNHEFEVSQVYRKALNYKFKTLDLDDNHFNHLAEDALNDGNDKLMLSHLKLVAKNVEDSGNYNLNYNPITIETKTIEREKFLVEMHELIDMLENIEKKKTDDDVEAQELEHGDPDGQARGNAKMADAHDEPSVHTESLVEDKDVDDTNGATPANKVGFAAGDATKSDIESSDSDNRGSITNNSTQNVSSQSRIYERRSMATKEEEIFIEKYARFLDAVPRKIKRILNVYNVSRFIARKDPTIDLSKFLEKLFQYTVLQELCPYRTSWLVYISGWGQQTEQKSLGKDGSTPFYSLLKDLSDITGKPIESLDLGTVYTRIVSGVLHCLPTAKRHVEGDSGLKYYDEMLEGLLVGDLFPKSLKKYTFNLPQHMMNDIKMYSNHSIIEKQDVGDFWVAAFSKVEKF